MQILSLLSLLLLVGPFVLAQDDGARMGGKMAMLRQKKVGDRERCRASGRCGKKMNSRVGARCVNGMAGEYPCSGIDLGSMVSHADLGSTSGGEANPLTVGEGSDVWGWVSPSGREFACVTQTDGSAFVEVLPSGEQRFLGRLPTNTVPSLWRDAKNVGPYMFIGSEARNHGVQVFDMRKLEAFGPRSRPAIFTADAVFTGVGSSHNIVNMADSNYLMVVGQKECSGSPYIVDIRDPLNPKKVGCQSNLDGYSHDAQVIRYSGPDSRYTGREIVISYNEDTLTIYDATVKDNLRVVSRTGYEGAQYTHQGWLVDGAQTHILMNDELDEIEGTTPEGGRTATLVWNISDLEKPVQEGIFSSPATSIGHNAYPKDGYSYASNYCSGLRVTDTRQVNSGGGAASMKEVAFFDVRPEDDSVEFFGAWSHFIFPSGWIAVNSIERGSFIVRVQPGVLASGGKKGGPKGPKGPK